MAKKRTSKVVVQGVTSEQAEQAFADYATADAKIQETTARMDKEMIKVREKYSESLTDAQSLKDKSFEVLQIYATEHPELFSKKKSIDGAHGTYGFRTGTPKLVTLKGFTWPAVTNLLKEFLPDYVRTTDEAAKDRLLADRELESVGELLPKCGIKVAQTETFYVELKKEDVPEA